MMRIKSAANETHASTIKLLKIQQSRSTPAFK